MTTIETATLRDRLEGRVVTPDDTGYDDARAVYNGMIDRRPAVIARCSSVADVRAALEYGRRSGLAIAVRGGGHNGPGFGTVEGGLVIDLAELDEVAVDAEARTVRVQGGCTWKQVDAATHEHGLATPSGIFSTTGVGGLTLGGGHGYLSRKYGLTVDNLLAAEVVLADGRVVTASETEHPDLFWALRGGGGNFGIVTSFLFRCHPVSTVIAGSTLWPVQATAEVLSWYRDFLPAQDEDLYGFFATMVVPPGDPFPAELHLQKACGVVWCYTGDPAGADAAFAPVRRMAPQHDDIGPVPFDGLQSAFDPLYPKGLQWYWKGDFVRTIPDEAVAVHARFARELPSMHSTMHLYPVDGAVQRVGAADTAWAHRDVTWSSVMAGIDPDPRNAEAVSRWAADYWSAQHPYSAGGAYVNFMMDEGPDRVRATYGGNHDRLAEIKAIYDPENVLRQNQNIAPAR